MTEKQRWLLRDLESWRDKQMERIGKYGPKKAATEPRHVRTAKAVAAKAAIVIRQWEKDKDAPWRKQKEALHLRAEAVKRIILFEKTDAALKALRALK